MYNLYFHSPIISFHYWWIWRKPNWWNDVLV